MVNVQIRNVPEEVHRVLKQRAAQEGMSLSEYLLKKLQHLAGRPTMAEWLERLKKDPPVTLTSNPAEIIREARGPI